MPHLQLKLIKSATTELGSARSSGRGASDEAHSVFLNTRLPLIGAPVFVRARARYANAKEYATESERGR